MLANGGQNGLDVVGKHMASTCQKSPGFSGGNECEASPGEKVRRQSPGYCESGSKCAGCSRAVRRDGYGFNCLLQIENLSGSQPGLEVLAGGASPLSKRARLGGYPR